MFVSNFRVSTPTFLIHLFIDISQDRHYISAVGEVGSFSSFYLLRIN